MKIEVINQQKLKRINFKLLHKHLERISSLLNIPSKRVSILLCDNNLIKCLNKKYFRKCFPTDVISFPLSDDFDPGYLGEIVISVEEAVRAAKYFGCGWQRELVLYIVHGILHLLGYDDIKKRDRSLMEQKQEEILDKLGL